MNLRLCYTSAVPPTAPANYWAIFHDHRSFIAFVTSATCGKHAITKPEKISLITSWLRGITSLARMRRVLSRLWVSTTMPWFCSCRKTEFRSFIDRLWFNILEYILSQCNLIIILILVNHITFELWLWHKLSDLESFICASASNIFISFLDELKFFFWHISLLNNLFIACALLCYLFLTLTDLLLRCRIVADVSTYHDCLFRWTTSAKRLLFCKRILLDWLIVSSRSIGPVRRRYFVFGFFTNILNNFVSF